MNNRFDGKDGLNLVGWLTRGFILFLLIVFTVAVAQRIIENGLNFLYGLQAFIVIVLWLVSIRQVTRGLKK